MTVGEKDMVGANGGLKSMFEGNLMKRGGVKSYFSATSFKMKYVMLMENGHIYYFNKKPGQSTPRVREIIPVEVDKLNTNEELALMAPYTFCMTTLGYFRGELRSKYFFQASSLAERDAWIDAINLQILNGASKDMEFVLNLETSFRRADLNNDGSVCIQEVRTMFARLNAKFPNSGPSSLEDIFKAKSGNGEAVDKRAFMELMMETSLTPAIENVFMEAGAESIGGDLAPERLAAWFQTVQGQRDFTTEDALATIRGHSLETFFSGETLPPRCDILTFANILRAEANTAMDPAARENVYQDDTRPICDYWINSSHNTYLTGDQLQSDSRVDMYRIAFMMGARCVELDCWDGKDGEPVIYHGFTLTSKIKFSDVIQCVKDYGFKFKSQYPIVLSLENHCSAPQQDRMAHHLTAILGDMLWVDPGYASREELPTLGELKGKVVCKGKRAPPPTSGDGTDALERTASQKDTEELHLMEEYEEKQAELLKSISAKDPSAALPGQSNEKIEAIIKEEEHAQVLPAAQIDSKITKKGKGFMCFHPEKGHRGAISAAVLGGAVENTQKKVGKTTGDAKLQVKSLLAKQEHSKHKVSAALSDTIVLGGVGAKTVDKYFRQGEVVVPNHPPSDMTSFGETRYLDLMNDCPKEWVAYNTQRISRIYPGGFRVKSSNYEPVPAWALGCQMVALNMQTWGRPMHMNKGRFLDNGECGYVLKPVELCSPGRATSPGQYDGMPPGSTRLKVQVLCAMGIPNAGYLDAKSTRRSKSDGALVDKVDPYVKVEVVGAGGDSSAFRTKCIKNNGYNPDFSDGPAHTFQVSQPRVAMLYVSVYDEDQVSDDAVGYYCAPLPMLREGVRYLQLRNWTGDRMHTSAAGRPGILVKLFWEK